MKYDKQRKALAHAKAVENAANYLMSLNNKGAWNRPLAMLRLPIKLAVKALPPPAIKKTVFIFPPIEEWDRL